MGSQRAKKFCFSKPKWSTIIFEKMQYSPIFDQFLVPQQPISRHFGILHVPITRHHGLEMGEKKLFEHSKWSTSFWEKCIFEPFFFHFWSQNGPFSRHFGIFRVVTTGSKRAKTSCLSTPNGLGSLLEKCIFEPFLTHFWSQNGPFLRLFGIWQCSKRVTMGSKWAFCDLPYPKTRHHGLKTT